MLPQLVAFGGMAAACWFGTKWIKQEVNRVDVDMKRAQRMLQRVKNSPMPQLRFNPVTGHYYPVD
jgi:hypothetical protein